MDTSGEATEVRPREAELLALGLHCICRVRLRPM